MNSLAKIQTPPGKEHISPTWFHKEALKNSVWSTNQIGSILNQFASLKVQVELLEFKMSKPFYTFEFDSEHLRK